MAAPVNEGFDKGTFSHELAVIQKIYHELEELDAETRQRVLNYVVARFEALDRTERRRASVAKEIEHARQGGLQGARSV